MALAIRIFGDIPRALAGLIEYAAYHELIQHAFGKSTWPISAV